MTDDPFATETVPQEITAILRQANRQIETTSLELDWLEAGQNKLIGYLHTLLDLVGKLEIEKNVWKFRAEEIEHERGLWESKAEDALAELQKTRRRAAELSLKTGEARCPNCGSNQIVLLHGMFPTGVTAPDGTAEEWYECALECQECQHREDIPVLQKVEEPHDD